MGLTDYNKHRILHLAETIDALRIFPRFYMTAYMVWMFHITNRLTSWIIHMPAAERTVVVVSLMTAVTTGVFGLFIWFYKIYSDASRDWSAPTAPALITNSAHTTVIPPAVVPHTATETKG